MKIYTKTGDNGTTSLLGGKRIFKNSRIISAIGRVDEVNSYLGIIIALLHSKENYLKKFAEISKRLTRVQNDLFQLGAELAAARSLQQKLKISPISEKQIKTLENEIDSIQLKLPKLTKFILPGGHIFATQIFYARSLCRRAERAVVEAFFPKTGQIVKINPEASFLTRNLPLNYLNRLSDWLFVLARELNMITGYSEVIWPGRKKS
ncbi:MAG TPA: cob(I)yrinic acid a,c-diamide adenosyltransferase [Candidatus Dojkabacteria bacterium]|nr:cob(I)yrinic acid a,c-diamide adenosyltransferase [Candidatus Dojkabacteria bacterium]